MRTQGVEKMRGAGGGQAAQGPVECGTLLAERRRSGKDGNPKGHSVCT